MNKKELEKVCADFVFGMGNLVICKDAESGKVASRALYRIVEHLSFPEPEKEIGYVVTYCRHTEGKGNYEKVEFEAFNREHTKEQFQNTIAKHNTMGNFCELIDITEKS